MALAFGVFVALLDLLCVHLEVGLDELLLVGDDLQGQGNVCGVLEGYWLGWQQHPVEYAIVEAALPFQPFAEYIFDVDVVWLFVEAQCSAVLQKGRELLWQAFADHLDLRIEVLPVRFPSSFCRWPAGPQDPFYQSSQEPAGTKAAPSENRPA